MILEMIVLFYKRELLQRIYHWAEIMYLGAMQNRRRQRFCRRDDGFSHNTLAFVSAIAACRRELERPYIYFIYIKICL